MEIIFLTLSLSSSPLGTIYFYLDGSDHILKERIRTLFTGEYHNPNLPTKPVGYKGCIVRSIMKGNFALFSQISDHSLGFFNSFSKEMPIIKSRISLRINSDYSLLLCDNNAQIPPNTQHIASLKEDSTSLRISLSLLTQIPLAPGSGGSGSDSGGVKIPRLEVLIEDCGEM